MQLSILFWSLIVIIQHNCACGVKTFLGTGEETSTGGDYLFQTDRDFLVEKRHSIFGTYFNIVPKQSTENVGNLVQKNVNLTEERNGDIGDMSALSSLNDHKKRKIRRKGGPRHPGMRRLMKAILIAQDES